MRWYLSPWIGDGGESPFVPAGSEHALGGWSATDGRADSTQPGETALWSCDPTPEEHAAIIATEGVDYIGEEEPA